MTGNNICPTCGLRHQCICSDIPHLDSPLHLSLLTHEKELDRDTNTGRFVANSLINAHIHEWQRTTINPELEIALNNEEYLPLLLYPAEESISVESALTQATQKGKIPYFILLDATWQEARKMERKSQWLAPIQRVALMPSQSSQFHLRRNQKDGALCTLEVVAELLESLDAGQDARQLRNFLTHFMAVFQADKSGHKLSGK